MDISLFKQFFQHSFSQLISWGRKFKYELDNKVTFIQKMTQTLHNDPWPYTMTLDPTQWPCPCVDTDPEGFLGALLQTLTNGGQWGLVQVADGAIQPLYGLVTLSLSRGTVPTHRKQQLETCWQRHTLYILNCIKYYTSDRFWGVWNIVNRKLHIQLLLMQCSSKCNLTKHRL